MKNYIEAEIALEKISAIRNLPENQDINGDWRDGVVMAENAVKEISVVEAITTAEAKTAMDEAVAKAKSKAKAELAEAKAEIETLTKDLAELQSQLDIARCAEMNKPEWIHIDNKLPEDNVPVLVFGKGTRGVKSTIYTSESKMWRDGTIAFWMSYPAAPNIDI